MTPTRTEEYVRRRRNKKGPHFQPWCPRITLLKPHMGTLIKTVLFSEVVSISFK